MPPKLSSLRIQGTCLGREAPKSSTAKPATCPKPFPAAPQLCLNHYCCSRASQSTERVCQPPLQTSWVRDENPPDPSLQELIPFIWPDWMLCQPFPASKPPVLGRHSPEPPEPGLQRRGCRQLRLSPYLPSPLTALPTSSLQQLSSEHCLALGAAVLSLPELSWARQIYPDACK